MTEKISLAEAKKHTTDKKCWIIIHNDVYDVSKFLSEHPGGAEALLNVAGKDGTGAFEDVGHSDDAKEMLKKYKIGTLAPEDKFACVCGVPKRVIHDEKPWRTCSDCADLRVTLCEPEDLIVVVDEPPRSNWWKYALLALAGALIIGFVIRRRTKEAK